MVEYIKQQVNIYVTIFQYGMLIFIGAVTALVTYIGNNHLEFDVVYGALMVIALLSFIFSFPCIFKAEREALKLQNYKSE